jgi:hypothetical protein
MCSGGGGTIKLKINVKDSRPICFNWSASFLIVNFFAWTLRHEKVWGVELWKHSNSGTIWRRRVSLTLQLFSPVQTWICETVGWVGRRVTLDILLKRNVLLLFSIWHSALCTAVCWYFSSPSLIFSARLELLSDFQCKKEPNADTK